MSKNPNYFPPEFDLSKAQVAHDLALLMLAKHTPADAEPHNVFNEYLMWLDKFNELILEETNREYPARTWTETVPPGHSVLDKKKDT